MVKGLTFQNFSDFIDNGYRAEDEKDYYKSLGSHLGKTTYNCKNLIYGLLHSLFSTFLQKLGIFMKVGSEPFCAFRCII